MCSNTLTKGCFIFIKRRLVKMKGCFVRMKQPFALLKKYFLNLQSY
ncbi:MAG: hypothetical protein LBL74_08130 [Bacteroidales bacterium]|nr:hypothetical protein [Bacteroidales bacterium]